MNMLWFLAYAILAIRVCSGLQPGGGDGTSTLTTLSTGRTTVTDTASEIFESAASTSTTYSLDLTTITAASSSPFIVTVSPTTVWSAILEIPTTNNLGQSITVTEISTHSSFYDPSPPTHGTTSKPPISTNSVFSSEIWITTTNSLGETIITWHWEISTITFDSAGPTPSGTTSTSALGGQTSSQASSPTSSTTPTPTTTAQKGPTKAELAPVITVVGILVGVFFIWLFRRCAERDQHASQPKENKAWWNPFCCLCRVHPFKNNTPRGTRRGQSARRPTISSPIPMPERSTSPPSRPARPLSLSDSLMEDMRTSPQPQANPQTTYSVIGDPAADNHHSFSPEPLPVVKYPETNGPFGPDLERSNRNPYSTTSWSSSVYSTATAGPSQPRPAYQPYRQPGSPQPEYPPPTRIEQQEFLPQGRTATPPAPRINQRGLLPQGQPATRPPAKLIQQVVWPLPDYPQYYDDDESDTEIRRIKREEALKMLEEGAGATSEGEEDDVKSVGSYDFADARAKKVLADKRVREEHNSRGNPSNDRAPSPEYPGKGKGRA